MRSKNRLLICLMIIALAGQGMVPGLVLCRGEEGHAAVEIAFDQCCSASPDARVPGAAIHSLDAMDPPVQHGCVSCSDTPIPANPLLPAPQGRHEDPGQTQSAAIATVDIDCPLKRMAYHWTVPLIDPLIPVTTSVLLI